MKKSFIILSLLLSLTMGQDYYNNTFESEVGNEWSSSSTHQTPDGTDTFLGEFGNSTITLSLDGFIPGEPVDIQYELWILRSWDGSNNDNLGDNLQDRFSFSINDNEIFNETFSNVDYQGQTFPNGQNNYMQTGAYEVGGQGYPPSGSHGTRSIYLLNFIEYSF